MFSTKEIDKSPLTMLVPPPGETCWTSVQLVLNTPWFMVTALQALPTGEKETMMFGGTMLLGRIEDVERMMAEHAQGILQIKSLLVVTPGYINGTEGWKMEPLKAVWMAEEASAPGRHLAEIYETEEGVMYNRYGPQKLINRVLRFRWNG